jgi:hypothetical protein
MDIEIKKGGAENRCFPLFISFSFFEKEAVPVLLDAEVIKAQIRRWARVKKGAPLVVEVAPHGVADGKVSVIQRTKHHTGERKLNSKIPHLG